MKNSYLITDINRIEFKEQGYTIIDNFLAQELHDELLNEFDEANSEINYQLRHGYYQEKLKSNNINHPDENECYIAKFKKLKSLKKMQSLQKFFEENIISIVKEISNNLVNYSVFPTAVKLSSGDLYRVHHDAYNGEVGYSYFINRGWKWDYGGILTYIFEDLTAKPIFPKSNRLLLRNERFKQFHFLNSVENFATSEQYIILGWASENLLAPTKVLGDYKKI
jgi:Rps23 Pro-64 3,4-dihydroxylase Tpa1-like proline 4-hydroxylase